MKVNVKWDGKRSFISECPSGHTILMDANQDVGGDDRALRPTEALLSSIGGCTGIDVIMILEKMQQKVTGYSMEITGRRQETEPKYFTDIHIKYILEGKDLDEGRVKRAIELSSTKYCGVIHSLKAKVTTSYEIVNP